MANLKHELSQVADQWVRAAGLGTTSVRNLAEFVSCVAGFFKGGGYLFRGEGRLYDVPLSPSLYRANAALSSLPIGGKRITTQEISEVETCQAEYAKGLIADRYLRAFIPSIHRHDVNWLPLARHFGYKTRLLDVTHSPLVALYFACIDKTDDEDAYVYAVAAGNFRPVNDRNPPQKSRSDYPPVPISYLDLFDVDVAFWNDELDDLPYVFEPTIPQQRMQAQAGKFLFWRRLEPVLHARTQLMPIRIGGAVKTTILSELSAFGITAAVLFPEWRNDA